MNVGCFRSAATALVLVALQASWAWAAELKVTGETKVAPYKLVSLKVEGTPPGYTILWDVYPEDNVSPSRNQKLRSTYEFVAPPGVYKVKVRAFKGDEDVLEERVEVVIGGPAPPGPTPPGPAPPTPADLPFPGVTGLHALVVYETADLPRLPAAQTAALTSKAVRDYLNAKNPGGWRVWDADVELKDAPQLWRDEMARAKGRPGFKTPWLVVGNGKDGYSGPLPADTDALLSLLKKYGG